MASSRRNCNSISSIRVGNDVLTDPKKISLAFKNHFKSSYNEVNIIPIKALDVKFKKLCAKSTSMIEAPFTEDEVWSAIGSLDGSRAPGPDGFNLKFYKKFWVHMKKEVMNFFKAFYKLKLIDKSINHTFITLIPKKSASVGIEDFKPISLVGSMYKILARVLSKRLASCISEVVEDCQFAFIHGKQIADCAFIANELINDLTWNKRESVIFKADFSPTYDAVD
ncbi:hypothetical protein HRI_002324500 [Hibiscus trionum]|uniref:Reverse transcriptase domain-containing protein n=1 Tax=Hibiscus trionum TaxID=183268 RepID=A0A9W7M1Z3_HIBTR|nr:hypothetical protein HRI_002324500 [Hibiscus trionum]